jgi:uncharacterized protein YndB with AHSA1/START domain
MSDTVAATRDKDARTITITIDVNASPEDVWRALTDAAELVRWFPLQARVTPGPDGSMRWSWDDTWSTDMSIETWTPPHRPVLVEERPAFDADGKPVLGSRAARMTMEFTLEAHGGGTTRLRLVHSGFGSDAGWDDELDATSAGWNVELRNLRHYLESHRGHDRIYTRAQHTTTLPSDDVWRRLLGPSGFHIVDGRLEEHARCTLRSLWGEEISGSVLWIEPEWDVLLAVDRLDRGLLRLSTWKAPGQTGVHIWLSAYNPSFAAEVSAFGLEADSFLDRALKQEIPC